MGTLLDLASLVMIPSGYKDDKLYSVKPTDGSGDFTFSRDGAGASPATRVNASGLIEKGRENLIFQSNIFDTTWATSNASVTSGQSGYDGSSDAWLLEKSAADAFLFQTTTTTFANVQSISIYAKAGSLNWININVGGSTYGGYFDLANGVTGSNIGSPIATKITDVGGGWYRCEAAGIHSGTTSFRIYPADANGVTSGTSGNIYIQDAQLEQGLVATDYIETTTAPVSAGLLGDMPRLDYHNPDSPTPNSCPNLLLEPSRVNGITQSEYFDGGSLLNTTITASYNTADTLSPEGVYNAAKLTATGSFPRYYDFPSTSDNTDIVISSFAKAGDASVYSLFASDKNLDAAQVYFDLSAGTATLAGTSVLTPVGYDIEPMGNGWYRCWLSINTGTGASSVQIRPISHAQGQTGGWSGSNYIYAYGAQYETNASYPTSYIPTYGSASTRAADSCSKTGISSLIGQTEGTLFCDFVFNGNPASVDYNIMILGAIGSDYINIGAYNTSLYARIFDSTEQGTINALSMVVGTRYKVAIGYANNDVVMYVNGVNVGIDTSASIPTLSQASFTRTSFEAKTDINQALLFKTRLTNAELAALTTI